jgi:hypothetical protein
MLTNKMCHVLIDSQYIRAYRRAYGEEAHVVPLRAYRCRYMAIAGGCGGFDAFGMDTEALQ